MTKLPYKLPADEKMQVDMLADILKVPRGLIRGDLTKISQAMAGVVLYRHVERKEKQEIMAVIHSLQERALTGVLVTKVTDVTVNPQWGEWSLSNQELEELVNFHATAAAIAGRVGTNPGLVGIGGSVTSMYKTGRAAGGTAWAMIKGAMTRGNVIGLVVSIALFGIAEFQAAEAAKYSQEMDRRKSYN